MSNEAQGLVRNLPMDAPGKPILMAYANYADEGGYCFPGVETIAFDTGYSVPTVVRVRRQLVKSNWLRSKRQFGTSATTRLNLPKIAAERVDRGDRTKVRPEFEFNGETPGQHRTDQCDLNGETPGQHRTDQCDLNGETPGQHRTDQCDLNSEISAISTRDHTDHLSLRDSSGDPSVEGSERASETASPNDQVPEWALRLVAELDFGKFRRPTQTRALSMARKVLLAKDQSGLSEREIRRHCRAALNEATNNAAAYLDGALDPHRLPVPAPSSPPQPSEREACTANAPQPLPTADSESDSMSQIEARAQIREVLASGRWRSGR